MREEHVTLVRPREASGLTLAARAAGELLGNLLDLALRTTGADRVALLLLEEDGTLACHAMRGGPVDLPTAMRADATVCGALQTGEPVLVGLTPEPSAWQADLAARSLALVGLQAAVGPMGLLAVGWDERRARRAAAAAGTAGMAVARVLEAAIAGEAERRRALERQAALDAERARFRGPLADIYVRSGLLRLQIEDGGSASEAAEFERLSQVGLEALGHAAAAPDGSQGLLRDLAS